MKAPRLNQAQKDFVLLLACIQPNLTYEQIQALFLNKFNQELTYKQLKALLRKIRPQIEATKASEVLTFELAKKVGLITLTEKINRLAMLEDIAKKSVNGDSHEFHTSRGTAITINKKDFNTAISAIKAIREEAATGEAGQSTYVIQVQDATPPNHEDYQSLETDEDL